MTEKKVSETLKRLKPVSYLSDVGSRFIDEWGNMYIAELGYWRLAKPHETKISLSKSAVLDGSNKYVTHGYYCR